LNIAISGAGVAGPALAYWLLRCGHRPTLIERAPALRTGGYVIDFWGVGYQVAQRMGIESALRDAGYQVQQLDSVGRDGRVRASMRMGAIARMTGDRFTSLPRGEVSAILHAGIADRAETIFGDSIAALDEHAEGLRVQLEHGGARDFDLLIGADGLHSNVRGLVFGPESDYEKYLGCRVAACVVEGYRSRDELVYKIHNVPGRQVARFTLRDNRTLFLFVFRSEDRADPGSLSARKALLRRTFADAGWEGPQMLDAMDTVDELYFDVVSQIRMDDWSRGRVALIGDAAACISLLGGEGTGLAMTEAYVLAGELHRAGGNWNQAFAAYEARLRPFVEGKQAGAERLIPFFASRSRLGIWLRDQALRAMSFEPLVKLFAGRSLRDDFELPDYGI
jgi:2-polyprenyl-6-methoxyphenol hydroxylase-like FAD-dependent oxidoreductase